MSAHDISDGGFAVALAEMSFKNQIGVTCEVPGDLAIAKKLFSETGGFITGSGARKIIGSAKNLCSHYQVSAIVIGKTT